MSLRYPLRTRARALRRVTDRASHLALATALLVTAVPRASAQAPGAGSMAANGAAAAPVVLTIEGGGSLGVYEAGMTWAFVEMFKHSDAARGTRDARLPALRLDAVSGASAGSINALLAATAWCERRRDLPPERSTFWLAWVPTGLQQLLPRHGMEGFWLSAGVFSRVYFRDVVFPALDSAWTHAEWDTPERCGTIPVGATLTRLQPERVPLGNGHVSAMNQRWAATFDVATRRTDGAAQLAFEARPADAAAEALGTVAVLPADGDGRIARERVFDVFAASSGYPLAFGPYTVSYRSRGSAGWRTTRAQFSDGGVFDNGPLGLGLALWFDGKHWPAAMAGNPNERFPRTVFVSPGRRRVWDDRRVEDETTTGENPARLLDPRASGVAAVFNLVGGAVPSARQNELQQTLRLLRATRDKGAHGEGLQDSISVSGRWHPIMGARLSGFAGFLGRPFRQYDFYVGIYDAFATVVEAVCESRAHGATRAAQFACTRSQMAELIARPPIPLGPVAPAVLRALYAREFEPARAGAGMPGSPATATDSSIHVMLVLERAMGAFMHVPSDTAERRRVASLRACRGEGGPLVGVVCGSGLRAVLDTLRADPVVRRVVRDARKAGGDACSRSATPDQSHTCLVDERFVELLDDPTREMHRVARSLLDRVIVTTPDSSTADLAVRAVGAYYFSSDGRYRRGIDMGQTSIPPREGEWHVLPSSVTASVGMPGAIVGWEARFNANSRLAAVVPARVAFGRFEPAGAERKPTADRLITGLALDWKLDGKLSSLRAGYNLWLGTDRVSRDTPLRDHGAPYVGAALLASKLRISLGPTPRSLRTARPHGWIGEVGIADLNGILYWARQGARGGRTPIRSEPTDSLGCIAAAPGAARPIGPNDTVTVQVPARLQRNRTGVMVDSGVAYRVIATGHWKDGRLEATTAAGFRSAEAPLLTRPLMFAGQLFKRERGARWFELVGELPTGSRRHVRFPTAGEAWTAPRSGELDVFANDAGRMYGNNRGCLTLTITRAE